VSPPTVLVLGGGPDAEHAVSVDSSRAVAAAIDAGGRYRAKLAIFDTHEPPLGAMEGEVVFPVLHGPWGEGGPLQRLLEADGRPFVGCGGRAARLAIDKLHTKQLALSLGVATPPAATFHPRDGAPPIDTPLVVKPVHEGSSVGLRICRSRADWPAARAAAADDIARGAIGACMVEPLIAGAELTVGVLLGEALPIVRIEPASGVYDYDAKYARDDTRYSVAPELPPGLADSVVRDSLRLARAIGCAMLCRVDFLAPADGPPQLLEVNTMPGFTSHSLLPKAAAHAGLPMPALCERLIDEAIARHANARPPRA